MTAKTNRQMIEIAEKIIEQQEAAFQPGANSRDRYGSARLRESHQAQAEAGEKPITVAKPPPDTGNVVEPAVDALKKEPEGQRRESFKRSCRQDRPTTPARRSAEDRRFE